MAKKKSEKKDLNNTEAVELTTAEVSDPLVQKIENNNLRKLQKFGVKNDK